MEAKPGEASSPAPAAAATSAEPAPVAAVPEATVSFQSPESVAPTAAAAAPAPSAVEKISSTDLLVPPGYMTMAVVAAGGGGFPAARPVMKVGKKRGRPRKYGPDGSLIRPLNATPISASVPMAASVAAGQYTPASAVGAAMKRGRGRPIDFAAAASKPYQHHLHQHQPHQSHQPQQQFGFHFGSIGLRNYETGDWMPAADRPMA